LLPKWEPSNAEVEAASQLAGGFFVSESVKVEKFWHEPD